MQAFFEALEIDEIDAEKLFKMLARGKNSHVHIEELMAGCMKMGTREWICRIFMECQPRTS